MNRLVLIGNGFDLAHGLKTSYADFIDWYFEKRYDDLLETHNDVSEDPLLTIRYQWHEAISTYLSNQVRYNQTFANLSKRQRMEWIMGNSDEFDLIPSPLFKRILLNYDKKNWEGIEQDYYDILKEYAFRDPKTNPTPPPIKALNKQLRFLQKKLVEYLTEVCSQKPDKIESIDEAIYAPIKEEDVAIGSRKCVQEHKEYWERHEERDEELRRIVRKYGLDDIQCLGQAYYWRKDQPNGSTLYPDAFLLPKEIMLLNFNYTNTSSIYRKNHLSFADNHIHGNLDDPKSIIFGYGDELDDKFKELKEHKNNACLSHIKSIRYLEAPNYRNMLSFIESEPFQVIILGHSCGNSDRTLLNTIFEHPNCVSIKPYYYVTDKEKGTDNYTELVQLISRNFNDMKLMRDRVVNKTQCQPLIHD